MRRRICSWLGQALFILAAFAAGAAYGAWSLDHPEEGTQYARTADISGSGLAPDGDISFTFQGKNEQEVIENSTSGTSVEEEEVFTWSATIPSPSGGWSPGDLTLELIGPTGNIEDSVVVYVE